MDKTTKKITPILVLAMGIMAVSSASILIRYAQSSVSSIVIAAYRLSIAAVVLAPFVWIYYRKNIKELKRRQIFFLALSGLFLAVHFATWITSLEFTSIASSVVLVTTTPIWVAIFSPLFLKEKISGGMWVGILVTISGSMIVSVQGACFFQDSLTKCSSVDAAINFNTMLGNFLAVCGAWAAAGYLIIGRKIRNEIPITAYIFCVYGIAAILLIVVSIGLGYDLVGFPKQSYLWLILLGVIPQLIGHSSFNFALGYLPAAFVSVALVGEPLGTIFLAYLLLQEQPGPGDLLGGLFIVIGIVLISYTNHKKKTPQNKKAESF